jgi:hypothetical protein
MTADDIALVTIVTTVNFATLATVVTWGRGILLDDVITARCSADANVVDLRQL